MNAAVALWALWLFRHELRRFKAHMCGLCDRWWHPAGCAGGGRAHHHAAEDKFYQEPHCAGGSASPYQRIVVTQGRAGHRLYLNGNLQFAERDEYRYHEALVHPAMRPFGAPRGWPCWAVATAWPCAKCSSTPRWNP